MVIIMIEFSYSVALTTITHNDGYTGTYEVSVKKYIERKTHLTNL